MNTDKAMVTYDTLRAANIARQQEWDAGNQLTLAYRGNELAGEVGEACNLIKKIERERLGIRGSRATREQLAEELADVIICTDLVAMSEGIDLDAAVSAKFNMTSEKVGLSTRLSSLTLERGEAEPVTVKPLEWEEGAPGTYTEVAESPFGHYTVWEINGTGCWSPWKAGAGTIAEGGLSGAKAAAQSDYETRILSALSTLSKRGEAEETRADQSCGCDGAWDPDGCEKCTPPPSTHVSAIEAAQITMGGGLVDVTRISQEGRSGILFRPRDQHIPVGEGGELQAGEYWPVAGDVVIWIENEGGAQVIQNYLDLFKPAPSTHTVRVNADLLEALKDIVEQDDDAKAAAGKAGATLNGVGLVDLFDCIGHPFGAGQHKQLPLRSNNLEAALIDARSAIARAEAVLSPAPSPTAAVSTPSPEGRL